MSVNALGEAAHRMFACGQIRDAEEGMVARNADEMVAHLTFECFAQSDNVVLSMAVSIPVYD